MLVFTTPQPRWMDDPGLGDHFLRLIGDGDEYGAVEIVTDLLADGVPPQRIMIDLIAGTQSRVGELWAAGTWTIAREHAATAISERALAAVAARTAVRPTRGRITVACVDGEWHALPVRILAEILRLDGWRVDFLGANVPGPHLMTHLHQTLPDAVALSCMLSTRLPRAHAAISACRSVGVPVIAGGRGFGPGGRYAGVLGADAWAADAEQAAVRLADDWLSPAPAPALGGDARSPSPGGHGLLLSRGGNSPSLSPSPALDVHGPSLSPGGNAPSLSPSPALDVHGPSLSPGGNPPSLYPGPALVGGRPPLSPRPAPGGEPSLSPGPALGGDDYVYVVRRRAALISAALHRLAEVYPPAQAYDQRQHDHTAEDFGHIVDFLTAALYVGDKQIFTDFVDWTAAVLAARDVPPAALRTGLALCREQLADHPEAVAVLDAGAARVPV